MVNLFLLLTLMAGSVVGLCIGDQITWVVSLDCCFRSKSNQHMKCSYLHFYCQSKEKSVSAPKKTIVKFFLIATKYNAEYFSVWNHSSFTLASP